MIALLHFTGALLLILFIVKLFCANELTEIAKSIAVDKINFANIVVCFIKNDAKVCTKLSFTLDKYQKV